MLSEDIANEVVIGATYRHFKGEDRLYRVIAIPREESLPTQRLVVYEQLYDSMFPKGTVWARTLEDFLGYATKDGEPVKRFTLAGRVVDVEQLNRATEQMLELNRMTQNASKSLPLHTSEGVLGMGPSDDEAHYESYNEENE